MSNSTTTSQPASRSTLRVWPASPALALLVLRLALGAIFIAHGAQKVFVYGFAGTSASFGDMGVPLEGVMGPLVALLELVGGILLVLGVATRVVAAALTVNMIVATLLVHLAAGIFVTEGGYELTLMLGAASLALVLAGPGRLSLDTVLTERRAA
jgi:putative oxidoreductase